MKEVHVPDFMKAGTKPVGVGQAMVGLVVDIGCEQLAAVAEPEVRGVLITAHDKRHKGPHKLNCPCFHSEGAD